jgi:hypothetical protein
MTRLEVAVQLAAGWISAYGEAGVVRNCLRLADKFLEADAQNEPDIVKPGPSVGGYFFGPHAGEKVTKGTKNICIGTRAGADLVDESLMLCIKLDGYKEIRKKMTLHQHDILHEIFDGTRLEPEEEPESPKSMFAGIGFDEGPIGYPAKINHVTSNVCIGRSGPEAIDPRTTVGHIAGTECVVDKKIIISNGSYVAQNAQPYRYYAIGKEAAHTDCGQSAAISKIEPSEKKETKISYSCENTEEEIKSEPEKTCHNCGNFVQFGCTINAVKLCRSSGHGKAGYWWTPKDKADGHIDNTTFGWPEKALPHVTSDEIIKEAADIQEKIKKIREAQKPCACTVRKTDAGGICIMYPKLDCPLHGKYHPLAKKEEK